MPFEKGQSGNPSGRRKGSKNKAVSDKEIRDMARKATPEAFQKLQSLMRNSENDQLVFKVAKEIIGIDMTLTIKEQEIEVKRDKLSVTNKKIIEEGAPAKAQVKEFPSIKVVES